MIDLQACEGRLTIDFGSSDLMGYSEQTLGQLFCSNFLFLQYFVYFLAGVLVQWVPLQCMTLVAGYAGRLRTGLAEEAIQ